MASLFNMFPPQHHQRTVPAPTSPGSPRNQQSPQRPAKPAHFSPSFQDYRSTSTPPPRPYDRYGNPSPSYIERSYRDEAENRERSHHQSYLSRFGEDDEPLTGDVTWVKKPSRQRRFTNGTIPQLHVREEAALAETANDFDDNTRREVLEDMNNRVEDMSGFVQEFVTYKEEEMALFEKMFDDEGNPIQELDEFGNPIPFPDEDGYTIHHEIEEAPKTVTIDTSKFTIKEGWMWKKGSGIGPLGSRLLGRKNWTRRYFKINMAQPIQVFYYTDVPPPIPEKTDWETQEQYKQRRVAALVKEKRNARGWVRLTKASVSIPETPKVHKNPTIDGRRVFHVVIPDNRSFSLYCETQEDFEKWTHTMGFITETMQRARERLKKGSTRVVQMRPVVDETKRDAALACTAFGKGLFEAVAGQPAEFTVQAVDPDTGAPMIYGGQHFTAVLESRELHYDLDMIDNNDGTYTFKYIPTRVGTYELSLMLDDYDITGSPFNPTVRPAPVSAPHCVAEGAGLFCAVVGVVNQFSVHPRNSFNQIITASGVPFCASARPPLVLTREDGTPLASAEAGHTLKDNGDGSYSCFYVVSLSAEDRRRLSQGEHLEGDLQVTLDDHIHNPSFPRHIKSSPFRPVIAASATGAALAAAARQATMALGSNSQMNSLIAQFATLKPMAPAPMQQQQPRLAPQPQRQGPLTSAPPRASNNSSSYNNNVSTTSSTASPPMPPPSSQAAEPWSYLPVRREPDFASTPPLQPPRQSLDAEREQLLRLRRELQEGRSMMTEQVGRVAVMGRKVQAGSERVMMAGPPLGTPPPPFEPADRPRPSRTPATPGQPDVFLQGFDAAVLALFNKHASALRRVFRHYAVREAGGVDSVRLPGLVRLAQDFDITPTFSNRKEIKDAFDRAARGGDVLGFAQMVEALGLIAIEALGKPMFAHLYTTDAARVSVLLVMWGLGDPASLDAVVARGRYS